MREILTAFLIFLCLVAASLGSLALYERMPSHHRHDDTNAVVRLVANIFVVMTSLVLSLMINSAKNTFETIDHNVHSMSTELILLDRNLREYGPETDEARQRLLGYVRHALFATAPVSDPLVKGDPTSEDLLNHVGESLRALKPADTDRGDILAEARERYQRVVQFRWVLVEESEGTIPAPLIVMLVAWLVMIFASFGYRAPRNMVVISSFVLSAFLIACALYLILDMDVPFSGPIQVSDAPLRRVLAEMQR